MIRHAPFIPACNSRSLLYEAVAPSRRRFPGLKHAAPHGLGFGRVGYDNLISTDHSGVRGAVPAGDGLEDSKAAVSEALEQ